MQNITLPGERFVWVQVATQHQKTSVLQWRTATDAEPSYTDFTPLCCPWRSPSTELWLPQVLAYNQLEDIDVS